MNGTYTTKSNQMDLLGTSRTIVHYFDSNGALRSARLVRWIKKGKSEGSVVVEDAEGNQFIPDKIRNIEEKHSCPHTY